MCVDSEAFNGVSDFNDWAHHEQRREQGEHSPTGAPRRTEAQFPSTLDATIAWDRALNRDPSVVG
jgi:hypothetical protein